MSDEPETLILVSLRRLDAKLDRVVNVLHDHGRRLNALDIAVADLAATAARHKVNLASRLRRDLAQDAELA
jgi:hypothetical protein